MKKTIQKCLHSTVSYYFYEELNKHLTLGWRVVPTTLVICVADFPNWTVVVEKEID
jgi:hypothetical protein